MNSNLHSPIHKTVLDRFHKLKIDKRLAHAYLFIGPKGIGKSETAIAVAKLLNCNKGSSSSGCECPSCVKIDNRNHPDVFVVEAEDDKKAISIEQLRTLISRLELHAIEAEFKVCLIKNAELMSIQAANAFLKTLEEPRKGTILILTTSVPETILKTVLSRCHQIHFFPLGQTELADWLKNEYDVQAVDAGILARLAQGSPGKAKELGVDFLARKNEIINEFIFGPGQDALFKKYSGDKAAWQLLEVLLTFYRDLFVFKNGGSKLIHADRLLDLQKLEPRYSQEELQDIIEYIVNCMKSVKENFNTKVALVILKEML